MTKTQRSAYINSKKAAESVVFWDTMPEFRIMKGNRACTLWGLRNQLDGVVLSVPTARLEKM